ncbi:putative ferric reductase [Bosea sp. OAE506]|uniref:ferric reductase-like transmembrane domain-containing protein n=1 Tax=Bosea sp. OAE506 TaxID=2663870 RepID=UPI001789B6E3
MLALVVAVPIALAAASPLLAWRDAVYIASGFAGILALALLLVQPLLAGGYLPALPARRGRPVHAWLGAVLVALILLHVAGLWLTSPPDVIDALLFASPTPFSVWGVVAMWAVFASAALAAWRARFRLAPRTWRLAHTVLAVVIVLGSVLHAWLVDGTMEPLSKAVFCLLVLVATAKVIHDLRALTLIRRTRRPADRSA